MTWAAVSAQLCAACPGVSLNTELRRASLWFPGSFEQGRALNQSCPEGAHLTLTLGDYEHTAEPSESFDAVYAIESNCYASGADKSAFLQEAHRLLRPGGRLVGSRRLPPGQLRGPQRTIFRRLCGWAIGTLGEIGPIGGNSNTSASPASSSNRSRAA